MVKPESIGGARILKNLEFITVTSLGTEHAFTTRNGGISQAPYSTLNLSKRTGDGAGSVKRNQDRVLRQFGSDIDNVCGLSQIHSARIVEAKPNWFEERADGMVTDQPDNTLVISMADCYPLLVHDPVKKVIGAAHAGWRGTLAGIALSVVETMTKRYGSYPSDLRVAIGPGISGNCYQVGPEVADRFRLAPFGDKVLQEDGARGIYLDLVTANILQLVKAGVVESKIQNTGMCTHCDKETFFSHRRDGNPTGRHWALVRLPR